MDNVSKEKVLRVVKVDGIVFVGFLEEGQVTEAYATKGTDHTELLNQATVGRYVEARNLDELDDCAFGSTSAIMSRKLKEQEVELFALAEYAMKNAKTKAVSNLENTYFRNAFAGK